MGPFRDYRRVIQTTPRCCNTKVCAATRNQPALLRQMFRSIVERSWDPAEIRMLRRAASTALLLGTAAASPIRALCAAGECHGNRDDHRRSAHDRTECRTKPAGGWRANG